MNTVLWVDDLRDPHQIMGFEEECTWAKNYQQAIDILDGDENKIHHIYLDNDLGDENDRQGRHVFDYIEELLYEGRLKNVQYITVHSDNASAVRSIMTAKDNFKRKYGIDISQMILSKKDYQ